MSQFVLTNQDNLTDATPFQTQLQRQLSLQAVVFRKATDGQHKLVLILPESENRKWETLAVTLRTASPGARIEALNDPTNRSEKLIYLELNHVAAATLAQQCRVTLSPEGCPPLPRPTTYAAAAASVATPPAPMPPDTMLGRAPVGGVSVLQMTQPPGQPMQPVPVQMQQPLPAQQQQQYQQPPMQAQQAAATPTNSLLNSIIALDYYAALSAYFPAAMEGTTDQYPNSTTITTATPPKILFYVKKPADLAAALEQAGAPCSLPQGNNGTWVEVDKQQLERVLDKQDQTYADNFLRNNRSRDLETARETPNDTRKYKLSHAAYDLTLASGYPAKVTVARGEPFPIVITCPTANAALKILAYLQKTPLATQYFQLQGAQGTRLADNLSQPAYGILRLSAAAFDALKTHLATNASAEATARIGQMAAAPSSVASTAQPPMQTAAQPMQQAPAAAAASVVYPAPPTYTPPPVYDARGPATIPAVNMTLLRSPQGLQAPERKSPESVAVHPDLLKTILETAQINYTNWVKDLHSDKKPPDAGLFSRFRHGQGGIDRVQAMLNDFSGTTDGGGHRGKLAVLARYFHAQDAQTNRSFFQPRLGTNAHNHSFISFFLNALKEAHQQASSGSAQQQAIAQIITKDLGLDLTDVLKNNSFTTSAAEKDRRDALNKIKAELVGCVERPALGKRSGM